MRIAIVNDRFIAVEAIRHVLMNTAPGQQESRVESRGSRARRALDPGPWTLDRLEGGEGQYTIAWIARDGVEAVERCAADCPDLILMDLIMPRMDGVEATRRIMARTPCAIVAVTASMSDNTSKVFEAIGAGALDAINTPVLNQPGNLDGVKPLLAKIEMVRRLIEPTAERESWFGPLLPLPPSPQAHRVKGESVGWPSPPKSPPQPSQPLRLRGDWGERASKQLDAGTTTTIRLPNGHGSLVAIGASAGGPVALAKVLSALSADFPAAVVVVQHVDEQFAPSLMRWLGSHTRLPVRLAEEGEQLWAGTVFLAAREQHLVLASSARLGYTLQPADCSYRPSVDVFFKSVERYRQGTVVGVLLTGMGRDGAVGLKALRARGHHTIAQDEATSAAFGMPRAALELDAATDILALDKIGPRLMNILAQKK